MREVTGNRAAGIGRRRALRRLATTAAAGAAAATSGLLAAVPALAQPAGAATWPTRTLRFLVPFAPGGPVEVPTRLIAEHLAQRLGHSAIVETRTGAGGAIGTQAVVQQNDPHLLLATTGAIAIQPALLRDPGYDPFRDLVPITLMIEAPLLLVVRRDSPIRDLADLLRRAREKPGAISYASSGIGASTHLAAALLAHTAGVELLHVPYRGAAQVSTAVYAGDTDLGSTGAVEAAPHIREGRLRALSVSTAERAAILPDVPSAGEVVPGYDMAIWYALFGPRALSPEAVRRILVELAPLRAEDSPLVRRMAGFGARVRLDGPEPLAERLRKEVPQWRALAAATGLRIE